MQRHRRAWSESGAPMWKSSPQFPAADCRPRRILESRAHYTGWLRKYEHNGSRVYCSRLSLGQGNPPAENQRSRCALPAGSGPIGLAVTNRGTRAIIILTCSVACRGPRNTRRVPTSPASLIPHAMPDAKSTFRRSPRVPSHQLHRPAIWQYVPGSCLMRGSWVLASLIGSEILRRRLP